MKLKYKSILLFVIVLTMLVTGVSAVSWPYDAEYRYNFTINVTDVGLTRNLTNVPIFVQLSDDTGKNSGDVTAIFDEIGAEYTRMALYNPDREFHTYVEVETWDEINKTAALWFIADEINYLDSTKNIWEIYFDDNLTSLNLVGGIGSESGKGVWNTTYMAVWHMVDDGTGNVVESTGNRWYEDGAWHYYNGTNYNAVSVDANFSREALRFDGIDDYIDCSRYYTRSVWNEYTNYAYISPGSRQSVEGRIIDKASIASNRREHTLGLNLYAPWAAISTDTGGAITLDSTNDTTLNKYVSVGSTYSDSLSLFKLFQDGYDAIAVTHNGVIERNERNITLMVGVNANNYKKSNWASGDLDEVRIVNVARDDDYLYTTFFSNNDTLNDFGTLEVNPDMTPTDPPQTDFTSNKTKINPGGTVQFVDLSLYYPANWNWTFGDGGTSVLEDPTYVYTDIGDYSVSLNTSNVGGYDVETKVDYISVRDAPTITSVSVSNLTPEIDTEITFSAVVVGEGVTYLWNFGDMESYEMTSTATHIYTIPGEYNTSLIIQNDYGVDEVHTTVTVLDHPGTQIDIFNAENIASIEGIFVIGIMLVALFVILGAVVTFVCKND